MAEELVLLDPKLIVASSPPALLALMRFTQTIPIVMTKAFGLAIPPSLMVRADEVIE